jgi:hypothetical protein
MATTTAAPMTTTGKTIRGALKAAGFRASVRKDGEWFAIEIGTADSHDIDRASALASAVAGIFFDRVSVTGPNGVCGHLSAL